VRDRVLASADLSAVGRNRQAQVLVEPATREDPKNLFAWFQLGVCYDALAQDDKAIPCYTAAVALDPTFHGAHVNPGLAYLRRKESAAAILDFDRALELNPDLVETCVDRALARQGLGQYPEAIADLDRALERGSHWTRIYFLRSRLKALARDPAGA